MNCKCGGTYQYFNSLEEIVFPIGLMKINHDGWKCNKCHRIKFDKELSEKRINEYHRIVKSIIGEKYPFNENDWIDCHEFSLMTGYNEQFVNSNIEFFKTMIFSFDKNNTIWFLKKSVLQYLHTDDGRFKLNDYENDEKIMHVGCPVCGVGDINKNGKCTCCGSGKGV